MFRSAAAPAPPVPGILASRRQAGPALLRMLSRARRSRLPLLLIRLEWPPRSGAEAGRDRRFLEAVAAELRICDLAWWEAPRQALLLLLESAETAPALLARLEGHAQSEQIELRARAAAFPRQGLTLAALMEQVE